MSKIDFQISKVAKIELGDLHDSIKELLPDGSPVGGITHEDLIGMVLETFGSQNQVKINSLVAVNNADRYRPGVSVDQEKLQAFGEGDPRAMMFRRIHANIQIGDDGDIITNIGMAWHQLGFSIGLGPMVTVCNNGCILGADKIISSYTLPSSGLRGCKTEIKGLRESLQAWNQGLPRAVEEGEKFIQSARNTMLDKCACAEIFGMLNVWRIRNERVKAREYDKMICPVNQTQLNKSISEYITRAEEPQEKTLQPITAWEFLNIMNCTLNPYSCDVPNIIPQQFAITDMVRQVLV